VTSVVSIAIALASMRPTFNEAALLFSSPDASAFGSQPFGPLSIGQVVAGLRERKRKLNCQGILSPARRREQ
jgi:hypothetical protein